MGFLFDDIMQAPFWIAAAQIIGVNIILSGDNAVVIALACLTLPPRQRLARLPRRSRAKAGAKVLP